MALAGCRTASGPEATARAYADALRDGRLDEAWELTNSELSRQEFAARYASEESRRTRAKAVAGALGTLSVRSGALVLVQEGNHWRIVEPDRGERARSALAAFLSAADSGNFVAAYHLLSADLRARYTAERLKQDYRAEPLAAERVARARAALKGDPVAEGRHVLFPIGEGKAVRLVEESEGFRVVALE
jgi:hypothetical protein